MTTLQYQVNPLLDKTLDTGIDSGTDNERADRELYFRVGYLGAAYAAFIDAIKAKSLDDLLKLLQVRIDLASNWRTRASKVIHRSAKRRGKRDDSLRFEDCDQYVTRFARGRHHCYVIARRGIERLIDHHFIASIEDARHVFSLWFTDLLSWASAGIGPKSYRWYAPESVLYPEGVTE